MLLARQSGFAAARTPFFSVPFGCRSPFPLLAPYLSPPVLCSSPFLNLPPSAAFSAAASLLVAVALQWPGVSPSFGRLGAPWAMGFLRGDKWLIVALAHPVDVVAVLPLHAFHLSGAPTARSCRNCPCQLLPPSSRSCCSCCCSCCCRCSCACCC